MMSFCHFYRCEIYEICVLSMARITASNLHQAFGNLLIEEIQCKCLDEFGRYVENERLILMFV